MATPTIGYPQAHTSSRIGAATLWKNYSTTINSNWSICGACAGSFQNPSRHLHKSCTCLAKAATTRTSVGYASDEALIPFDAHVQSAYRILAEYFAFPEKFNFFDVDLVAIANCLPVGCKRFNLHLAVTGLPPDSRVARLLHKLSQDNLLLGCTPLVNLFSKVGVPLSAKHASAELTIVADSIHAGEYEIYSIDSVQANIKVAGVEVATSLHPLHSLNHSDGKDGRFWVVRPDELFDNTTPGHEQHIAVVDADANLTPVEVGKLLIALTCTNGDLPSLLEVGTAGRQLATINDAQNNPIRLLLQPTPRYRYATGQGIHWRLISSLTLNPHALAPSGMKAFCDMLLLNDVQQSLRSQRHIAGIVGLTQAEASAWRRVKADVYLAYGIEVRLTLDEAAFADSSIHLFIEVIDRFLGMYVQFNSFVELVALSKQTGCELIRCQPRYGSLNPA